MSTCRVFSCVVGRGFLLWPVHSFGKTVLAFYLLYFPKGQDGRVERHAHLLLGKLENYNSRLNNCRQENVGSHQKKIAHIQGQRRSSSKMVGGAKSHLESNPIPTRDIQRAQTKPSMQQENPQRLSQTWLWVFACLLWKYGSAVAASLFHIWTILINDAVKFWPGKFPGMLTRMLEWVVFPLSRGSSQPRGRTQISHLQTDSLPAEPQGEPKNTRVDSLSLLKQIFLTQELNWALNLVTKLVSV